METPNYRFGIEDIDEQHRILIALIEDLAAESVDGRWISVYGRLADIEYRTLLHFSVEENLMRILRFPDVTQHMEQHAAFLGMVRQFTRQSLTNALVPGAATVLGNWLTQHIQTEDRSYAAYFLAAHGENHGRQ